MKALVACASLAAVVTAALLLHDGGRVSDTFAVAVANAAVRCPEGFTVKVHGLPAGSEPTSSLSESCVLDLGIPAGATGAPGPAGPAGVQGKEGPPGVSDPGPVYAHSIQSSKSNTSDRMTATAKCPAGKKVLGGSAAIRVINTGRGLRSRIAESRSVPAAARAIKLNSSKSNIYRTEPTPDGQGWTASAETLNTSKSTISFSLKVIAICIRLGPLVSRH